MWNARCTGSRRGFTLLELVAALVALSVLLAVAVPTYLGAMDRSHDKKAEQTLQHAMRAVFAVAVFTPERYFTAEEVEAAAPNVEAYAAGVSAVRLVFTEEQSSGYGVVSYEIAGDALSVGVAMRSETGRCYVGHLAYAGGAEEVFERDLTVCSGHAAGRLLAGWDEAPAPKGTIPLTGAGETVTGSFEATKTGTLVFSTSPSGPFTSTLSFEAGELTGSGMDASLVPAPFWVGEYQVYVAVRAVSGDVSLPVLVKSEVTAPSLPNAPGNLTATAYESSVDLTWHADTSQVKRYEVLQDGVVVASTTDLSLSVPGLVTGQVYGFSVRTVDVYNQVSPASSLVLARPLPPAPSAPDGLTGVAGDGVSRLTWDAVPGAARYDVYEGGSLVASSTAPALDVPGTNGTPYSFAVVAVDAYGQTSPFTSPVTVRPLPAPPPAPEDVTAAAGDARVTVTWAASKDAASYDVIRDDVVVGTVGVTRFVDAAVTNGVTYVYSVRATDVYGQDSLSSATASATPLPPVPGAPGNVAALSGDEHVTLSWMPLEGLTYQVLRGGVVVGTTSDGSFTETGLENGVSVTYQVAARDVYGQVSALSAAVSVVPMPAPPSAPVGDFGPTVEMVPATLTLGSSASPNWAWRYELSATSAGPWASSYKAEGVTVNVTESGVSALGTLPGTYRVYVRQGDGNALSSPPTLLTLLVGCNDMLAHLYSSQCATLDEHAVVTGSFNVNNNTTVKGDVVARSVKASNNLAVLPGDGGAGAGSVTGSTLHVLNGSNATFSGNVDLAGDLRNDSPSTRVKGNVTSSGGSVIGTKPLTVDGTVTVNDPGTIEGTTSLLNRTGPGLVPVLDVPDAPGADVSAVQFDASFTSFTDAQAWLNANSSRLGTSGAASLRLDAPEAGSLSLDGTVTGHLLVSSASPLTVTAWPAATPGSSVTVLAHSPGPRSLVVSAGAATLDLTTNLWTPGELLVAQRSVFAGSVAAGVVTIEQQTDFHIRPVTGWAGRVLLEYP